MWTKRLRWLTDIDDVMISRVALMIGGFVCLLQELAFSSCSGEILLVCDIRHIRNSELIRNVGWFFSSKWVISHMPRHAQETFENFSNYMTSSNQMTWLSWFRMGGSHVLLWRHITPRTLLFATLKILLRDEVNIIVVGHSFYIIFSRIISISLDCFSFILSKKHAFCLLRPRCHCWICARVAACCNKTLSRICVVSNRAVKESHDGSFSRRPLRQRRLWLLPWRILWSTFRCLASRLSVGVRKRENFRIQNGLQCIVCCCHDSWSDYGCRSFYPSIGSCRRRSTLLYGGIGEYL